MEEQNGFVEKPKYDDGTVAWVGDEFEQDGEVYTIFSVDYTKYNVTVYGMNESNNSSVGLILANGKRLKKPKDTLEKIMQEIEECEDEKLKERVIGYIARAHACGFECALELTREKDWMM